MASTPESVTRALAPSRQAFYHSVWQEHFAQLNLDSASKISVSDIEMAETLLSWLKDSSHDLPSSIAIPPSPITEGSPSSSIQQRNHIPRILDPTLAKIANITLLDSAVPAVTLTHALAHINIYNQTHILPILKSIFDSLVPQGIALVTITKHRPLSTILSAFTSPRRRSSSSLSRTSTLEDATTLSLNNDTNPVSTEAEILALASRAGFEVGKIRVLERVMEVRGKEDLARLRREVEGILDLARGQRGDAQSWERVFDEVWEGEVRRGQGALRVECWLLVGRRE